MQKIADTGLLKAALDADDQYHEWGARELKTHAPFFTCEAVLVELAFLLGTGRPGLILVDRGDLILEFAMRDHSLRIAELLDQYHDRDMDLADACLVCMAELSSRCKIWTVDRNDFSIYRANRKTVIECRFPR